jgi:hypothetical protein
VKTSFLCAGDAPVLCFEFHQPLVEIPVRTWQYSFSIFLTYRALRVYLYVLIMATASLDTPYLSTYLSIQQQTLTSLVNEPTLDLVNVLLQAVTKKAREHEEIKSEKLRLEVELENAVRNGEQRSRGLKAAVEKSLKDVEDLREKLSKEGKGRHLYQDDEN